MPFKSYEAKQAYWKKYQADNKTKRLAYGKQYRQDHQSTINGQVAAWNAAHPEAAQRHALKYYLKSQYGITIEEYEAQLALQNGRCAICGRTPEEASLGKKVRRLAVDHCHQTKKRRGLLCVGCNVSLGHLGDSIEILQKAISYLQQFQS